MYEKNGKPSLNCRDEIFCKHQFFLLFFHEVIKIKRTWIKITNKLKFILLN